MTSDSDTFPFTLALDTLKPKKVWLTWYYIWWYREDGTKHRLKIPEGSVQTIAYHLFKRGYWYNNRHDCYYLPGTRDEDYLKDKEGDAKKRLSVARYSGRPHIEQPTKGTHHEHS